MVRKSEVQVGLSLSCMFITCVGMDVAVLSEVLLHNVDAHNGTIQNIKVSNRTSHKVQCHKTYIRFVTLT